MANQTVLSHNDALRKIIASRVSPMLRMEHLNPDAIIGFIGDRGGGKSLSSALICLLDYMMDGMTLRSNMDITCKISVSDELAQRYGLPFGGEVLYRSEELDKTKFLRFDTEYNGCVILIEEINVWLADARRSMSTQNLLADDVGQQLRKLKMPLVYNCINEMFVDGRIRDLTDIFIHTQDTALTPIGLSRKQKQGIEFEWYLYPMTSKFTGERYADTKQRRGPVFIRGKALWGLIDTYKRQERKKGIAMGLQPGITAESTAKSDPANTAFNAKWGWVADKLNELIQSGVTEIQSNEYYRMFGKVPKDTMKNDFNVCYSFKTQTYTIGYCDLRGEIPDERERELVPA